jgi:hypothetical protein
MSSLTTPAGTAATYFTVSFINDGGMLAFKQEILDAAGMNRDIYYGIWPWTGPSVYLDFMDAIVAANLRYVAIGGPITVHVGQDVGSAGTAVDVHGLTFDGLYIKGRPDVNGNVKPSLFITPGVGAGTGTEAQGCVFEDVIIVRMPGTDHRPIFIGAEKYIRCEFDTRLVSLGETVALGPIARLAAGRSVQLIGSAAFRLADVTNPTYNQPAFELDNGAVIDDTDSGIVVGNYGPFSYIVARDAQVGVVYPAVYSNIESAGSNRYRNGPSFVASTNILARGTWIRGYTQYDPTALEKSLRLRDGLINRGSISFTPYSFVGVNDAAYNGGYAVRLAAAVPLVVTLPGVAEPDVQFLAYFRDKQDNVWRDGTPWLTLNRQADGSSLISDNGSVASISFKYCDAVILYRNTNDWNYVVLGTDERENDANIWTVPTLAGTWVDSSGWAAARYRVEGRELIIDGSCEDGAAATIFTLPVGYRPDTTKTFAVAAQDSGNAYITAYVEIATTGVVSLVAPAPSSHRVHLNGIRFNLS